MIWVSQINLLNPTLVSEADVAADHRTEQIMMMVKLDALRGVSLTAVGNLAMWRVVQFQTGTLRSTNNPAPTGASRCPSNAIATTKRTCSPSSTF